jgi:ArsR family transcriptional regulator, virulence genes transcriptional regulator
MDGIADLALSTLEKKSGEAAALLKALSNEHRLLILCHLVSERELTVGAILERVPLSQSALSQHLAKLREEGLVTFRRESQTLFYRVADARAQQVLELLRDIFCPELGSAASDRNRIRINTYRPHLPRERWSGKAMTRGD